MNSLEAEKWCTATEEEFGHGHLEIGPETKRLQNNQMQVDICVQI